MIYKLNSIDFVLFFVLVFILYWVFPKKWKNALLLLASYIFYASWNWKFLSLILVSTFVNYFGGLGIYKAKNPHTRKALLLLCITTDLSLLVFFKYFNFFTENVTHLLNSLGLTANIPALNIILPLGISFYTFETMSYTIDIYRKIFIPTENIADFALFVAYFPKLISGPIERARNIIPNIAAEKHFKNINFKEGAYLFFYGLFKKAVIADSLSPLVTNTFALTNPTGTQALIAFYAFAIQIYCDYSGYIDMARGVSNFFGITLSSNFDTPYFAKNPADFWRRWNMTLSSWVRDYVYIPLGGKEAKFFGAIPLLIAWFMMGLWHGAAWNYVLWGLYWFAVILAYRAIKSHFPSEKTGFGIFGSLFSIILMFHVTAFGWLIFRSTSISQIMAFVNALALGINAASLFNISYLYLASIMLFLLIYEAIQCKLSDQLFIYKKNFYFQLVFYMILFFMYVNIESISNVEFLYFQF